jgi:hypothetical protein
MGLLSAIAAGAYDVAVGVLRGVSRSVSFLRSTTFRVRNAVYRVTNELLTFPDTEVLVGIARQGIDAAQAIQGAPDAPPPPRVQPGQTWLPLPGTTGSANLGSKVIVEVTYQDGTAEKFPLFFSADKVPTLDQIAAILAQQWEDFKNDLSGPRADQPNPPASFKIIPIYLVNIAELWSWPRSPGAT